MRNRYQWADFIQNYLDQDEQRRLLTNAGWSAIFLAAFFTTNPAVAAAGIISKAAGDALVYRFLVPYRYRLLAVDVMTFGAMTMTWAYLPQLMPWINPTIYTVVTASALVLQLGRLLVPTARINGLIPH